MGADEDGFFFHVDVEVGSVFFDDFDEVADFRLSTIPRPRSLEN